MTPRYSEAFLLIWQLAGFEAQTGTFSRIHPEHFFLALCKADDIPLGALRDDGTTEVQAQLPIIERQLRTVRQLFEQVGLDRKTARRQLRALLGQPCETRPSDNIWHRTDDARWLCDRAFRLAQAAGEPFATPQYLLYAYLHPEASFPRIERVLTPSVRDILTGHQTH